MMKFHSLIAAAVVLVLAGCDLLTGIVEEGENDDDAGAVIVAVEGLSFVNTLAGELAQLSGVDQLELEERDAYLTETLSALLDDSFEIFSFPWSGDATGQTDDILEDSGRDSLRQYLREHAAYAAAQEKPLVVVGHSWGTVLTYLALSLEAAEPDPLEVDLYITLSTPLGTRYGHGSTYPEEAVITDYVEDWFRDLAFETDAVHRPRAGAFYNYWAWGDFISGPLAEFVPAETGVVDVRIDEGMFDEPDGTTQSAAFAYSNRNVLDMIYWHKFTTADRVVLTDEYDDYLAQDHIRDADVLFDRFLEDVRSQIHTAAGRPPHAAELVVTLSEIEVIDENEGDGPLNPADDQAEYYGYFTLSVDGDKHRIKRMRSPLDNADLEEGERYTIDWLAPVPPEVGSIRIEAELYEYEPGEDNENYPGRAFVDIDADEPGALPHSGSFDVSWRDATGGDNVVRVHYGVARATHGSVE